MRYVEQQIAILAKVALRIRDAHAILPSVLAVLRPGIYFCQQFPPALVQGVAVVRLGLKFLRLPIAGVQLIHLGAASVRMPRIRVDLVDLDDAAQIHYQAASLGAGIEKEVLGRLVRLAGDAAVVQLFDAAAVFVLLAVHDHEFGLGSGVGFGRWRQIRVVTYCQAMPLGAASTSCMRSFA